MKETQHPLPIPRTDRVAAADELVVGHATVGQGNGAPDLYPHPSAKRQALSEHDCIQQIALTA